MVISTKLKYAIEFSSTYQKRRSSWATNAVNGHYCTNGATGRVFVYATKNGFCIPAGVVFSGYLCTPTSAAVLENKNRDDLRRTWTHVRLDIALRVCPALVSKLKDAGVKLR